MIYLASPYTHHDPAIRQARFEAACRAAGAILRSGEQVFSPIAHSHPIAELCELPKAFDWWQPNNHAWLDRCNILVVLRLDGWDRSAGVRVETEHAKAAGKLVMYMAEVTDD